MADEARAQGVLGHAQVVEVIHQLCADHVFCRVSPEGNTSLVGMARFLFTEHHDDGARDLQVSVPGDFAEPEKGSSFRVAFDHNDQGMFFLTEFRQRVIYREKGKPDIDAWRIRYPDVIQTMQRREFYRVKTDLINPVRLSISLPGEEEEENPNIIGEMDTFEEIAANLWDISGGGLSFMLELPPPSPLTRGTIVDMKMRLPDTPGVTQLLGRVVYIKDRPDGNRLYCTQFVDTKGSVDSRHSQNNVLHYVAEREREVLATQHKLEEED